MYLSYSSPHLRKVRTAAKLRLRKTLDIDRECQEHGIAVQDLEFAELYAIRHHYRENSAELERLQNNY